jgi:RNase P/RNase MRP subunit p30
MNNYTLEFRYEELNKIVSFVQFQTELNHKDKNKIQKAIFKELHKIQDLQIKRSMK